MILQLMYLHQEICNSGEDEKTHCVLCNNRIHLLFPPPNQKNKKQNKRKEKEKHTYTYAANTSKHGIRFTRNGKISPTSEFLVGTGTGGQSILALISRMRKGTRAQPIVWEGGEKGILPILHALNSNSFLSEET